MCDQPSHRYNGVFWYLLLWQFGIMGIVYHLLGKHLDSLLAQKCILSALDNYSFTEGYIWNSQS